MEYGINSVILSRELISKGPSRFQEDFESVEPLIMNLLQGKIVLFLGACSFIGSETLTLLFKAQPKKVIFIDFNENELAELARRIQLHRYGKFIPNFEIKLVDINSPLIYSLINDLGIVDILFNFAATKHVRSERDSYGIVHMLKTNVFSPYFIYKQLLQINKEILNFTISTDKAANPTNFMGATKRLLEISQKSLGGNFKTTRFANVAFSRGSLLESWLFRVANKEPISLPKKISRYFISADEAGQICAISLMLDHGQVAVPASGFLKPLKIEKVIVEFLEFFDLQPVYFNNIENANLYIHKGLNSQTYYPVILSEPDTQGEKYEETFIGEEEKEQKWLDRINSISINIEEFDKEFFELSMRNVYKAINDRKFYSKFIRDFVKNFSPDSSVQSLDQRV